MKYQPDAQASDSHTNLTRRVSEWAQPNTKYKPEAQASELFTAGEWAQPNTQYKPEAPASESYTEHQRVLR